MAINHKTPPTKGLEWDQFTVQVPERVRRRRRCPAVGGTSVMRIIGEILDCIN